MSHKALEQMVDKILDRQESHLEAIAERAPIELREFREQRAQSRADLLKELETIVGDLRAGKDA